MKSLIMITPHEMKRHIAKRVKAKRLSLNFSQKTLSLRSGVSYGVLKTFERTGQISLESLLKLALVLGELDAFYHVFETKPEDARSLDELIKKDTLRKRGRT